MNKDKLELSKVYMKKGREYIIAKKYDSAISAFERAKELAQSDKAIEYCDDNIRKAERLKNNK